MGDKVCNTSYTGSTPVRASNFPTKRNNRAASLKSLINSELSRAPRAMMWSARLDGIQQGRSVENRLKAFRNERSATNLNDDVRRQTYSFQ